MNKKIVFLIGLVLFVGVGKVRAGEGLQGAMEKYGVSFPVSELGECGSFTACREYCEDPVHRDACVLYAKKKGFYKKEKIEENKSSILTKAQAELGCSSMGECKTYCEQEAHFEQCSEFAVKNDLGGGKLLSEQNRDILSKAEQILGCKSPSSCKAMCDDPANRDKCDRFAQEVGIPGGVKKKGPGGCSSEESCREYCEDPAHQEECGKFGPPPGEEARGMEGMCENEEECRKYCQEHPEDCPDGGPGPSEEDYCREHPEECEYGPDAPDYGAGEGDFCKDHPEECPGPGAMDEERDGDLRFEEMSEEERERVDYCEGHPEECEGSGDYEGEEVEEGSVQGVSSLRPLGKLRRNLELVRGDERFCLEVLGLVGMFVCGR